ncbi:MAG: hypothetical protein mread185_000468 [Mycoplasmataceae bacterium]|nr:MAG: hypothetical protein mread185_000468 [Mycoplasmataceae bacterium]
MESREKILLDRLKEYKKEKGNHHAGNLFKKWEKWGKLSELEKEKKTKYFSSLIEAIDKYLEYREIISKYSNKLNFFEIAKCLNDYRVFSKVVSKKENLNLSDQAKKSFRSSILEEFLFILFSREDEDWVGLEIGKTKAYSNLYFNPKSLEDFVNNSSFRVEEKNQDFAIYKKCEVVIDNKKKDIKIPILSIECKTYLDKTMLQGLIATAEKIKRGNPYAKFYVVTETYGINLEEDLYGTQIDQVYVLRKQIRDKDEDDQRNFNHQIVNHSAKQYANGMVHTNTIEGFWSHLKRGIDGTYHQVSRKHAQKYTDEFTFRYITFFKINFLLTSESLFGK